MSRLRKPPKLSKETTERFKQRAERVEEEVRKSLNNKESIKMNKPVNSLSFTIDVLQELYKFICSDMVEERKWFSDYEKQALLDAVIYLKWLRGHD